MTSTPPESAEVAGARARETVAAYRAANGLPPECDAAEWTAQGPAAPVAAEHARVVARYAWRRPPVVAVVSPIVPREPETPRRYVPVAIGAALTVTWEESIRGPREELLAGLRRALAASVAGVAPSDDSDVVCYSGRDAAPMTDVDDYLGRRD